MNDQQFGYWRFPLRELFVLTTVMAIVFAVAAIDLSWGVFFGGLFIPAFYRGRAVVADTLTDFANNYTTADVIGAIAFAIFIEATTLFIAFNLILIPLVVARVLWWFELFYVFTLLFDWWWVVLIFNHLVITWSAWPKKPDRSRGT